MLNRHGTRLDIGTADDVAELSAAEERRRREEGAVTLTGRGGGGGGGGVSRSGGRIGGAHYGHGNNGSPGTRPSLHLHAHLPTAGGATAAVDPAAAHAGRGGRFGELPGGFGRPTSDRGPGAEWDGPGTAAAMRDPAVSLPFAYTSPHAPPPL